MKKQFRFNVVHYLAFMLFLIGVTGMVFTVEASKKEKVNEHYDHLLDLCHAVDHNLNLVLDRCYQELDEAIESEELYKDCSIYFETGDATSLISDVNKEDIFDSNYIVDLVVFQDNKAVSVNNRDISFFDFSLAYEDKRIWAVEDKENEEVYILTNRTRDDTSYMLVLDFDEFYKKTVTSTLFSDYWIVIYSRENSLTLQNDDEQSQYRIMSEEEIIQRDDGFTEILRAEDEGNVRSIGYNFTEEETGDYYTCKMTILPLSMTENSIFSIGVASFNTIDPGVNKVTVEIIFSAFLLTSSVTILIYSLMNSNRRQKEQEKEIKNLEKQNTLLEEKNRLQEEVEHHKRLETIGTLTAGISHEFNNLLSPIMSESLLALENTPEDSSVYDNLVAIYSSSEKAKNLIRRLSRISRRKEGYDMHPLGLADVVEEVKNIVSSSLKHNIHIETEYSSEKKINGDESQLEYLLINLINNAVQAIGEKEGTIKIAVRDDADNVIMSVCDNGPGIADSELETIFDPFYTTKEIGKGTGLGLSIARRIATEHSGTLTARNNETGGAVFEFTVPSIENNNEEKHVR